MRSDRERLDAPRFWLPRIRARGLARAAGVGVLLMVAAVILGFRPAGPAVPPGASPAVSPTACPSASVQVPEDPPAGMVGFPLRLADPAVLAVLRAGARVDVLVRTEAAAADLVASDLQVLRTVGSAGASDGVLYLAASPDQAAALAAIGAGTKVSVTVRSPG